jgi:hypothetical protein
MSEDPLKPSVSLLVKLGSILVHVDEAISPTGHPFDAHTVHTLMADPEVGAWLKSMDTMAFLPKKRETL